MRIPKEIREKAGISPGAEVEVRYRHGVVEIELSASRVKLVQKGGFLVATVDGDVKGFTNEDVSALIEELRDERMHDILGDWRPKDG